jgi:protein-disulfide isomerase
MTGAWRVALVTTILLFHVEFRDPARESQEVYRPQTELPDAEGLKPFLANHIDLGSNAGLQIAPLRPSEFAGFYETTVSMNWQGGVQSSEMYLSREAGYLVAGKIYSIARNNRREAILSLVRNRFRSGSNTRLSVGVPQTSIFPFLDRVTVIAGRDDLAQIFFTTKDEELLVVGGLYSVGGRPSKAEIMNSIATENSPTEGPAGAPATIVEYSDFQCPACAQLNRYLESVVMTKYRGQIRIVFKEFPLTRIHAWSLQAAAAAQCVYRETPNSYVRYRSLIFEQQADFAERDERQKLLKLAEELGLDRTAMTECMDSGVSNSQIQADLLEGQSIGVASTPTLFLNGEVFVGTPPSEFFEAAVDKAIEKH